MEVTADMTVTLDGFASGLGQSREKPFGDLDPDRLHGWMFDHRDENVGEVEAIVDAGAFIMGRKMFDAGDGDWDLDWRGWWGENPPYHAPVFVISHRPRPSIEMEGGTTFHFVTEGIESALDLAREATDDRNVSIAGGPGILNQYLAADLVDELRIHIAPFVAGGGERIFTGTRDLTLAPTSARSTPNVTHLVYRRRS